uniref:Acyl CoA binding protein n=1 Tax=Virus NIOZ-UU159 TaxID=2763270 RepID=A0A7S9XFZ2_9VIRU|nr:MAG: acyl CoA binding protein [Virus NIOZ-UU159]|tara:strand:+ start:1250 stop:1522 length:273 start_codon:yes stop_codon:yes gene_type:complete
MGDKLSFEEVLKKLEKLNLDDFNLPDNVKLEFYKYYKQATIGNCNKEKPWAIYLKDCSKWDAWNSIKGMSCEDAKNNYVDCYYSYIVTAK